MSLQQDIDNLKASIDVNVNQKTDPSTILPNDVGDPIKTLADILANTGSYFPAGSVNYNFGDGISNDGSGSITLDTNFTDDLYAPSGSYQASGSYLTSASAASTYQPIGSYQASGSYLTSASAASTYQPKGSYQASGSYLTSASAASIYLTSASAAASYAPSGSYQLSGSYLTSASAASTYQPIGNYLTSASAAASYAPSGSYQASGNYLTSASAAATYQPTGNYLTSASAASTYQPIGNYLTSASAASVYLASASIALSINSSSNALTSSFNTIISSSLIPYELLSHKSNDTTLASSSATLYPTENAVKTYVDNKITGISFTLNVKVASTANVSTSSAPSTLDGVSLSNGDRLLLKDQTDGTQNGIYTFTSASAVLTRSSDANTGTSLANKTIPVTSGTVNADTWWTITNSSITIGTTVITLTQTGGVGSYNNGTGILLIGNTFSLDTSYTNTIYAPSGSYQASGSYQPAGNYLTSASAAASYAPSGSYQASGSYLTSASAASNYQPIGNYLTSASAASIYLTSASAASVYLTSASAASVYQPKGNYQLSGSYLTGLSTNGTFGPATITGSILNIPTPTNYTASNGVIKAGNSFVAGGEIDVALVYNLQDGNTFGIYDITGSGTNSYGSGSYLLQYGPSNGQYSVINLRANNLSYGTWINGISGGNYSFSTSPSQITQGYNDLTGSLLLQFTSTTMTFYDTKFTFGVRYGDDYSALGTLNPRWIPDYGAVTKLVNNATGSYLTSASAASTYQVKGTYVSSSALVTGDLTGSILTPTIKPSVNLTGTPTITTTPSLVDNTTKIATTAFVHNAINSITGSTNNLTGSVFNLLSGSTSVTLNSGNSGSGIATTAFVNNTLIDNTVYFSANTFTGSGALNNAYRINLTTVGSSGAATLVSGTLNIPQYAGGGTGVTTVGAFVATSQVNGATTTGSSIFFSPADANNPGMITTGSQTMAGAKNFSTSVQSALFKGAASTFDIILQDGSGNQAFRSTSANAWVDSVTSQFFQIGSSTGRAFFSAASGTIFARLGFSATAFSFSTANYLSTLAPTGIFDLSNGTNSLFNISSLGQANVASLTIKPFTLSAINSTATATAAQLAQGVITSTSAAATTITLPTATLIASQIGAAQGTTFDFVIDNSSGANTVTLILGSGMTSLAVITGSNTLTISSGSTGHFRLYFKSTTSASFTRLA